MNTPQRDKFYCNLSSKEYTSIPASEIPKGIETLDISNNPLINLKNLPRIPTLTKIVCTNSTLFSFEGAVDEPRLSVIDFQNCPVSVLPYYRLMASIAFGRTVDVIDDISLSVYEISLRDKYGPVIKRYVVDGYCLMSIEPIILYNPKTKQKKYIEVGPIGHENETEKEKSSHIHDEIADEIILEITNHTIKSKKKKHYQTDISNTNLEKLTYHAENLTALGAVKRIKGLPIPFPPYGYC